MPAITTKHTVEIETDISVYCDTCGSGLCRTVRVDHVKEAFFVPVCKDCMEEKELQIEELEKEIKNLNDRLNNEN